MNLMPPPPPPFPSTGNVKRNVFPTTAGILTIIAACISLIVGTAGIYAFNDSFHHYWGPDYSYQLMGILGYLATAFGFAGGILSIRRRYFEFSIISMGLTAFLGLATIWGYAESWEGSFTFGLLWGVPIFILSIISVIFAVVSKGEFA